MRPMSLALSLEISHNPHHTGQGLDSLCKTLEIHCNTRLKYRGSSVSVQQIEISSVYLISSQDENDSLSSTEEVSQLSTSTSRGAFPQQ